MTIILKALIPDTNIEFKVGDYVEVPKWNDDAPYAHSVIRKIESITDTLLNIRGYYNLYLENNFGYYQSSDVIRWYRNNICYYEDDENVKIQLSQQED